MAIPKITRHGEQVLLSTGLLDFPLSPLTLQEMALLDGPSSPSDCLIPACESLSLAPFTGSTSPKPILLPSVPAALSDELGSDEPPSHEVPDTIAPKSLAQIDPHWESLPKVKEVTAPAIIEFKTYKKEELDPSTGKIVRTHVIYPVIALKEKESVCISVPPLSEAKGQVNLLVSPPLAVTPVHVDGITSMTMTPRDPPTPCADQVEPVPAEPTRDVADSDDAASLPHQTPTPPRQTPPTTPCTPLILPPARDFLGSSQKETPVLPQLQAEPQASAQLSSVSPQTFPDVSSSLRTSSRHSSSGESAEKEEGQFDNAEEGEICDLQKLHPSEQPLPPLLSPSPTPSPVPSQVDQLVQRILETKRPVSGSGDQAVSLDAVAVVTDHPNASLCPEEQGLNDMTPMDTSIQGEAPNALHTSPNNAQPKELPPLKYTPLPPNAGRGTLIKQLFAPRGAFAAPRMVCPPPVTKKSAKELTALEPLTLPPLLPRTHIRPMTIEYCHLSSPLLVPPPVDTPIQAALNQVTFTQSQLSIFADQPIPKELTLPKPYSMPLPRTLPVTPVFDEAPVDSPPSSIDSENDLPLNSIPVAELRNAYLPEDASLMPIIISGPGLQKPGTAVKLLVSAPKLPRRRYGRSRNQRHRTVHAKAREDLVKELEEAADNRFYEWLETTDKSTDAEVADLLAGIPAEQPQQDDPAVQSPPGLSSPSHLYQSPLPPVDKEVSKYDVESDWMDSESDKETDQSPSPRVTSFSSLSVFRPIQPQSVYATGPAISPVSPCVLRVEGQPSCDGQVLHASRGKRVEGHSQYD